MRITKISVCKLFGRFNYEIELTPPTGIAILTAPNGYGKSTILKILQSFASGEYYYFIQENFHKIEFTFSDGEPLVIYKSPEDIINNRVTFNRSGDLTKIRDPFEENGEESAFFIDRALPFLTRVGTRIWRHVRSGEVLDALQVVSRYGSHPALRRNIKQAEWLEKIRASVQVYSISTNRLTSSDQSEASEDNSNLMVGAIAGEIAKLIKDTIQLQFEIGREKETSFPQRIIESLNTEQPPTKETIATLIGQLQEYESRLARLGLLPHGVTTQQLNNHNQIDSAATLVVLKTYLDDIAEKFSKLDDVANKLDVFTSSVNELFRFTTAAPSSEKGIIIRTKDGQKSELALSTLSSGEQHLIVIIGKLVFNTAPGSMVLIDEPEISFHPEWQEKFLDILERIRTVNDFTAIIATHSPIVIGDRWDDAIELAELYNNHSYGRDQDEAQQS
ncbi:AAA family ATPase [Pseudomonas cedrina]|uniref:AAA family ATPase n=1 Tax=Pseudomonas cedrina TaxID=651740 RepID=UPI003EDA9AAA